MMGVKRMESKMVIRQSIGFPRLVKWPRRVGYAAALWSLIFGALGLYWVLGGDGFPFGENDPRGQMMGSYLANLSVHVGGTMIALTGFLGIFAALAMVRKWNQKRLYFLLLFYAWVMCAILLFIIPDSRILQNVAYLFMFYFDLIDWIVIHQVFCMIGGVLWGTTALAYYRISRDACGNCGRAGEGASIISASKWGKVFTYCAVLTALPYGIVRFAWAIGIPLGTENIAIIGDFSGEAILGGLCFGGAILTLALIQKWGEVFPRWCLFIAGKRIPIWLVVIPATSVSVIIFLTGLKVSPQVVMMIINGEITMKNWGEMVPTLSWLPWGLSLGIATIAYYLRRRSRCKHCGKF